MLKKPNLSDATIITCLQESFGLHAMQVTFLPMGYENSAVYRVTVENGSFYFLKLLKGGFNEINVAVPAFLHAHGIPQVLSPLETTLHTLWLHKHGFNWILYPFFDGKTGFEIALSETQWDALGQIMRAVHGTILPARLAQLVPREEFGPGRRTVLKTSLERAKQDRFDDPIASRFAALVMTKHDEIRSMVDRAEQLALSLQNRIVERVLCHSDLHGRNLLIGADGEMAIVDWDAPILAPKERDLMFIGGGIGGIWNDPKEEEWFYEGYGQAEVDRVALSYYRYERILEDIADYSEQIFGMRGNIEDRTKALRFIEQFRPNDVVEIAHRSYRQLSEGTFR
jgi:spectinomycin phosphotransferase